MQERIVASILFDVKYNGIVYRNLDFGYHNDPDVTESYIHDEDGPWSMQTIGDSMIDFQIYGDPDTNELKMQACLMVPGSQMMDGDLELCWSRGNYLEEQEIKMYNIRVEYE